LKRIKLKNCIVYPKKSQKLYQVSSKLYKLYELYKLYKLSTKKARITVVKVAVSEHGFCLKAIKGPRQCGVKMSVMKARCSNASG
jgi:hypothetical protein